MKKRTCWVIYTKENPVKHGIFNDKMLVHCSVYRFHAVKRRGFTFTSKDAFTSECLESTQMTIESRNNWAGIKILVTFHYTGWLKDRVV